MSYSISLNPMLFKNMLGPFTFTFTLESEEFEKVAAALRCVSVSLRNIEKFSSPLPWDSLVEQISGLPTTVHYRGTSFCRNSYMGKQIRGAVKEIKNSENSEKYFYVKTIFGKHIKRKQWNKSRNHQAIDRIFVFVFKQVIPHGCS